MAGQKQGRIEKASEEGWGPRWAVEPMVMVNNCCGVWTKYEDTLLHLVCVYVCVCVCVCVCGWVGGWVDGWIFV